MRQKQRMFRLGGCAAVYLLLGVRVYANSSWVWISETRPFDVLPWVAAATILIEAAAVRWIAKVPSWRKILPCIVLANLLSFAAPYVFTLFNPVHTFSQAIEHEPLYTVGAAYLVLTLVIELPACYHMIGTEPSNRKRLLWTLAGANTVTTVMTAAVERLLCYGRW